MRPLKLAWMMPLTSGAVAVPGLYVGLVMLTEVDSANRTPVLTRRVAAETVAAVEVTPPARLATSTGVVAAPYPVGARIMSIPAEFVAAGEIAALIVPDVPAELRTW